MIALVKMELPNNRLAKNTISMEMVTQKGEQNKRDLPHELTTKVNAVKLYRQGEIGK